MDLGLPVNFMEDSHIMASFNTSMEIPIRDTCTSANLTAREFGENKTVLLRVSSSMVISCMAPSHMLTVQFTREI